jgi:predicted RNase H-like nuclease (RuvC/YqgF family)
MIIAFTESRQVGATRNRRTAGGGMRRVRQPRSVSAVR